MAKDKKDETIQIRCTKHQKERLKDEAKQSGLNLGDYLIINKSAEIINPMKLPRNSKKISELARYIEELDLMFPEVEHYLNNIVEMCVEICLQ